MYKNYPNGPQVGQYVVRNIAGKILSLDTGIVPYWHQLTRLRSILKDPVSPTL